MKILSSLCSLCLLLLCSSCATSTKNVANILKALGKDPATVNINLSSVYGTLRFERFVPQTNTVAAPDLAAILQAYQLGQLRFTQPAPAPSPGFTLPYFVTNVTMVLPPSAPK